MFVRDLFVDKKVILFFDVVFVVEGELVFVYKVVLKVRLFVLAVFLGGNFREGKSF